MARKLRMFEIIFMLSCRTHTHTHGRWWLIDSVTSLRLSVFNLGKRQKADFFLSVEVTFVFVFGFVCVGNALRVDYTCVSGGR